jgi:mannose-6-phosphate isomerase-like protein (cupin superfamily)
MGDGEREGSRPWGFYEVLSDDRADHKVKRITVWPGKRLSLQYHRRRAEHWIVVAGRALVTVNGNEVVLSPGQSIDVPLRALHRVESTSDVPLVFIEVQQGEYFGEDDIVRVEDDFGRV